VACRKLGPYQAVAPGAFICNACVAVFGQKQRAGIEEVISSPSRTPRLASVDAKR
jgi:hypothetical protein